MAQTKRKRQTKHRGNAAGMIETRGRTGRKPEAGERKLTSKEQVARRKETRLDRVPTWKSATQRALIAMLFAAVAFVLLGLPPVQLLTLLPLLLLYIPMGYYTDRWLYQRRQRAKVTKAAK